MSEAAKKPVPDKPTRVYVDAREFLSLPPGKGPASLIALEQIVGLAEQESTKHTLILLLNDGSLLTGHAYTDIVAVLQEPDDA
jgi:hypothetical protein